MAKKQAKRARSEALARSEVRLVWATKLLAAAMAVAIATIIVSGVLNWSGMTPAWLVGIPWVGMVGVVAAMAAVWAIFAAAMVWRHR